MIICTYFFFCALKMYFILSANMFFFNFYRLGPILHLNILGGGYFGVDTKQQLSKQRLLQNSEITKQRLLQNSEITQQRLLQNSDSYKTATVTKQRLLQKATTAKKNILIYSIKTLCQVFISLISFDIFNKNNFYFFYITEKVDFCNARMYRGQTPAVGQPVQTLEKLSDRFLKFGLWTKLFKK